MRARDTYPVFAAGLRPLLLRAWSVELSAVREACSQDGVQKLSQQFDLLGHHRSGLAKPGHRPAALVCGCGVRVPAGFLLCIVSFTPLSRHVRRYRYCHHFGDEDPESQRG